MWEVLSKRLRLFKQKHSGVRPGGVVILQCLNPRLTGGDQPNTEVLGGGGAGGGGVTGGRCSEKCVHFGPGVDTGLNVLLTTLETIYNNDRRA